MVAVISTAALPDWRSAPLIRSFIGHGHRGLFVNVPLTYRLQMPGTSRKIEPAGPLLVDLDLIFVQDHAEPPQSPFPPAILTTLSAVFPDPSFPKILNPEMDPNLGCEGETTPTRSFTTILEVSV